MPLAHEAELEVQTSLLSCGSQEQDAPASQCVRHTKNMAADYPYHNSLTQLRTTTGGWLPLSQQLDTVTNYNKGYHPCLTQLQKLSQTITGAITLTYLSQ